MGREARERAALLAFFLPLTRRTCEELTVGDATISAYLADVLTEFARSDRLYRIRAPGGRRLTSVVEMLREKGWCAARPATNPTGALFLGFELRCRVLPRR
jgi:hypothetical protein